MNNRTFDRTSLALSATLMLVGQLLYVVVTLFHTGGPANDHHAVFAGYARSAIWTTVHVAQFASMAILLGGLFVLFFALNAPSGTPGWAARLGAASTVVTFALSAVVQAVDGVALKQAVNAWVSAPDAEKAARLASAEAIRWLEWGMRSYENFTLGLALLLLATAVARTAGVPRPTAYLIGLSGLTYLGQGWLAGSGGFSTPHTVAIVLTEVLNVTWIMWLIVVARRAAEESLRPTASRRQPRRAASMVAMSIFFIGIIASNARFASAPPAASASVSARGVICQERPQRSLHQPHWLSLPPLPTIAFQ